ncbi:hypothetical protein BH23PLA1_BH23PLA1_08130 [soil metagenome]
MNLGEYRLQAQIGAGSDGPSYRAEDPSTGRPVEIRSLEGAKADLHRWEDLIPRLRMLAIVDHPGIVDLLGLELKHNPPFAVLQWTEAPSLASALADRIPLDRVEALGLARALAEALASAHRLGLSHGRLGPSTILSGGEAVPIQLDFTGIEARARSESEGPDRADAAFRAPETAGPGRVSPKADLYSLGVLLSWLLTGHPERPPKTLAETADGDRSRAQTALTVADSETELDQLVQQLLQHDPDDRPSAREVAESLRRLLSQSEGDRSAADSKPSLASPVDARDQGNAAGAPSAVAVGDRLGRFRLVEKLGQGGMGAVFRAEDLADGSVVALKVLKAELIGRKESLRRFKKEARLLSEIQNPYVTNFVEVNEDGGVHYIALEYVRGESLGSRLARVGRLAEPVALAIMAEVAEALSAAHERGIVHRDIKPDNILLLDPDGPTPEAPSDATIDLTFSTGIVPTIKLSDFGIARHVVETESLALTQDHAVIGTPAYMAPEQGSGGAIDPRTDVYAMGSTLFHLLAGRPPFSAGGLMELIAKHRNEPPPAIRTLVPGISEGACQVVEKALAKAPDDRYPDASAMLDDLRRVLRGEPTSITAHPRLPESDPSRVLQFDFRWELDAPPRALWPLVTNTERLNRAIGLPAVQFHDHRGADQKPRREAEARMGGLLTNWEEHPFEWVEPRRFGVLRTYTRGPFRWVVSLVELAARPGGGTTLTHRIRLEPASTLLRPVVRMQVGGSMRRALERVYRRIDAAISGRLGPGLVRDPFEEPHQLPRSRLRRLEAGLDRLIASGADPAVTEALGVFLEQAPAQEGARIRPLALARRLGLDPDKTANVCLQAAKEGLLVLLWDLLCPVCRIPSEVKETLRALKDHGRCEACNLDYELDFGNSIELIFRVHSEIRDAETATYCVGGPAHSPHVVAQVRVAPGERVEIGLELSEGDYVLRGPQLPFQAGFHVKPGAPSGRWEVDLARAPDLDRPQALRPGSQVLLLENSHNQELVARVERTASRDDALTAARASSLALFRDLFPEEVMAPGQLASVRNLTLLVTDLVGADALYERLGDARAFGVIHGHLLAQEQWIRQAGGAVVKTVGEGVLAAFDDPASAVQAAFDLLTRGAPEINGNRTDADHERLNGPHALSLQARAAIHRGAAMVATLNDHLDYFGAAVNLAVNLTRNVQGGELALSSPVASDPRVAALFAPLGIETEVVATKLPGSARGFFHKVKPPLDEDGTRAQTMQETLDVV